MPIDLYPNISKVKRNGAWQNLPGFVPQSGDADIKAMIANSESNTTAQYAHPEGTYFILNDVLYKAIINIAVNDTIAVGTNCEVAILGNDVSDLKDYVDNGSMALNFSDKRNAYLSNVVGETVSLLSSSSSYSFVNIVTVKKDNKYKIAVQNGSSVASTNKRDSAIVDSNNIILQIIPMMVLANNTEVMEFTAVENGFLILCVDKNYANITIYNITSKCTFQKDVQTALLNCLRKVAWIDEQGQDYIAALENAMDYIAYDGEFGVHQFSVSTYGYNGVSCGIYNGNHGKYQRTTSNNAGSYVIYNPINLNSSSANANNLTHIGTEPIFTIPANSTVVLEIKNISMNVFTGGSSDKKKASVVLRSTSTSVISSQDIVEGTNYLITSQLFENETPIYLLAGYCGGFVKTLEFDVAITVNGERWL